MAKKCNRGEGAVIEIPWQGEPFVESCHASPRAAVRAARKYSQRFHEQNPGGYGYTWIAVRGENVEKALAGDVRDFDVENSIDE